MQEKTKRVRITKKEKQLHIEKWRQSGLSPIEYSREFDVPVSSMRKWINSARNPEPSFKPVIIKSDTPVNNRDSMIEIIVDNRIRILLRNATDSAMTARIVREIMQCN